MLTENSLAAVTCWKQSDECSGAQVPEWLPAGLQKSLDTSACSIHPESQWLLHMQRQGHSSLLSDQSSPMFLFSIATLSLPPPQWTRLSTSYSSKGFAILHFQQSWCCVKFAAADVLWRCHIYRCPSVYLVICFFFCVPISSSTKVSYLFFARSCRISLAGGLFLKSDICSHAVGRAIPVTVLLHCSPYTGHRFFWRDSIFCCIGSFSLESCPRTCVCFLFQTLPQGLSLHLCW